ncbi:MAG: two-component system response regulator [Paenibacillaceae bacterium]|nr:two-component system response regulator [Paenibacillaceae bacterium]
MWTVLLVEDEEFVREAIRETVDWRRHGFCIAGEAGNGREALAAILEEKPDVVIADIVMPGMDGIELLKETRRAGIRSRFIMLTAMNHFDYARDALQYGAFNYLLKLSLDDETLLENLARIRAELLEELKGAGETLYPYYHRIWAGFSGGGGAPAAVEEAVAAPARERFGGLRLDILAVLSGGAPAGEEAGIAPEDYLLVQRFHEDGQTTFFCWSHSAEGAGSDRRQKDTFPPVAVRNSSLARLSRDWRLAVDRLSGQWYGQGSDPAMEGSGLPALTELDAELIRFFEERNEPKCAETAARMWACMEAVSFSHVDVKMTASRLLHVLFMLAGRKEEERDAVLAATSHQSLLSRVQETVRELIRQLKEQHVSYTDHPEVNRVIHYMLEHYGENIKVADLAKLVAMNVDYLSTVFGKKTGLTPIAYLQTIRMEQAKRLLVHTRLSVEEIAFRTGFADDAYFIKVFKRMAGQTPSVFRRENQL